MNSKATAGTLYGIGVGPGDPELIPVKAIRILRTVDIVYTASSTKNNYSLAVEIVSEYLPAEIPVHCLSFPMTKDHKQKSLAWQEHSMEIINQLKQGKNAAFLTIGDPLIYSTFGYVLKSIQNISPDIPIQTIPGITSYQAAAAAINTPLVEGEENLILLSGIQGGNGLSELKDKVDNVVFLKAYKNVSHIADILTQNGDWSEQVGVIRCSYPDQEIIWDLNELKEKAPKYWTLVLAKQKKDRYEK